MSAASRRAGASMRDRSAPGGSGGVQEPERDALVARILELLAARAEDASICPSDVARSLYADERAWRAQMPAIREAAREMARAGLVQVTQRQQVLDPAAPWHGPVRIKRIGHLE